MSPSRPIRIEAIPVRSGHEQLLRCRQPAVGYRAFVAIHSSERGPAIGGIRFWSYRGEVEARRDVLRLSRAMTLKCALAGLPMGGGKSVIMRPSRPVPREALYDAHARVIESLGGAYIGAPDVGTASADLARMRRTTRWVAATHGGRDDAGPFTALGVFRAMLAAAAFRGQHGLSGLTVAVQGCGNVGAELCRLLRRAGARLIVADVDAARAEAVAARYGASVANAADILRARCDIFAPCALGGVLTVPVVRTLRAAIVCGAANNQLAGAAAASALRRCGILYVPDFLANAGGVIAGSGDLLGWSVAKINRRIDGIGATAARVLMEAERRRECPDRVAVRLASAS